MTTDSLISIPTSVIDTFHTYIRDETLSPLFFSGDAHSILEQLPNASIDFCMTSPPYWNKRQYHNGGIGLEENFQEYISNIVRISAQIKRVLKPSGSFWLNIGDSYLNKELVGIPWRISLRLKDEQGWILRNSIIMTKILELYGRATQFSTDEEWLNITEHENCPYLHRKCVKTRKSNPNITIGTCSVLYGKEQKDVIICPARLLDRRQIFTDCIHLLTLHEPGNELHIISEVGIPVGSVDYFLVSARNNEIRDFVGIELQTLDTTGTTWPDRQGFLQQKGLPIDSKDIALSSDRTFGMNWKMTAKTILVQLHHKVQTFEELNKHLVLVIQDHFMNYIKREFRFDHINQIRTGDSAQFHVYKLQPSETNDSFRLELDSRLTTNADDGIAASLGLQTNAKLELEQIIKVLKAKMSERTLFTIQ